MVEKGVSCLRGILREIIKGKEHLTPEVATEGLTRIMNGQGTEAQKGAFLVALRLYGADKNAEIVSELAREMYREAIVPNFSFDRTKPEGYIADLVGTGGDGWDTFNVSTTASLVAAGAGLKITKHGSRASSSKCGSADVLEYIGCNLSKIDNTNVSQILEKTNFCFIFASTFHPSMRFLAKARYEIGFPTPFNMLGPLTNPSMPDTGIVGVYSRGVGRVMAESLVKLGKRNFWVVCGENEMDEINISGKTYVWKIDKDGAILEDEIEPKDFGLEAYPMDLVRGGTLEGNAELLKDLLNGANTTEREKASRNFVIINAAALLYVSGRASSYLEATKIATESIDSGKAMNCLTSFMKAIDELSP